MQLANFFCFPPFIKYFVFSVLLILIAGCSYVLPRDTIRYVAYPVQRGDTIASIAQKFAVPVRTIIDINHLSRGHGLIIGAVVKIPIPKNVKVSSSGSSKGAVTQPAAFPQPKTSLSSLGPSLRFVGHLTWPIPNAGLTSPFGWRWSSFHEGVDIHGSDGTPFYAAHDGVVVYSGHGITGYGNLIVIRGEIGAGGSALMTVYGHNEKNLVRVGQKVTRGDKIGLAGHTGKVTGPHLHFETRIRTTEGKYRAVDPLVFYVTRKAQS